jgi:putative DNA primase/helicase
MTEQKHNNKSADDPLFYRTTQPEVGPSGRVHDDGSILLDRNDPNATAHKFIDRKYRRNGHLCLYWKGDGHWQFNGSFYEEHEFNMLSAEVYAFMNAAHCRFRNNAIPMIVKPSDVDNVLKCIKAGVTIPASLPQPCWIKSEEYAPELFAFKNKLVNVRSGEEMDPTPRLWVTDTINFNYDPDAKCPRWKQFLEEIHPNDPDAQNCIEEQLGYGMTYDMHFEKIAVWIGLPRAGKSTLLYVMSRLVGNRAFAPMSFNDWMRGEKSRENLIGKKVLAFSDVRLKPPRWYGNSYDPGGLDHASIQSLLKISGRDSESIGRLYKKAWEGQLTCKVIITSNHPLDIHDPVLLSRLVMVNFQQSWLHRDDDRDDYLREKLDAELSGIANRCLAAYRRLLGRGRFIQPASARRLVQKMVAQANPIPAFMQEWWIKDDKAHGPTGADVHYTFELWCEEHRQCDLLKTYPREQELMKAIKAIAEFTTLKRVRSHGEKVGHYPGIRRRTERDRRREDEAEFGKVQLEEAPTPKGYRRF